MPPNEDNSHYEKILATGEVKCIDDEIPFEIPKSWEWVRVKMLGDVITGSTPPTEKKELYGSDYPFFKPTDLGQGLYTINSKDSVSILGFENSRKVTSGSVLITCIGATIGKTGLVRKDGICNQQINAIIPLPHFSFEYIYFACISSTFQEQIKRNASSTTLPILNKQKFETLLLPIPPLSEQQNIVAKLKEILPIIENYNTVQVKLDTLNGEINNLLKKSILQEAIQGRLVPQIDSEESATVLLEKIKEEKSRLVKDGKLKKKDLTDSTIFKGDDNKYYEKCGSAVTCIESELPFEIPDSWRWCKIGDIFRHNNGKQLNKGNNKGVLMDYITTSNLYWNGFVLDSLKQMPFEETEIERCQAEKGDLLVCEGGDVGRSCIWMYDKPIMLQNHIHKLRAYIPICTKYFYYIFYLYNLMGIIGGKGIGIQGFSSKALHNTRVPLPPKEEQYRIVEKVEQALTSIMSR